MPSVNPFTDLQQVRFQRGAMVRITGLSKEQKAELCERLTIENPKVAQIRRFSGWVPAGVPRYLFGYIDAGEVLHIAPGAASDAWRYVVDTGGTPVLDPTLRPAIPTHIGYRGEPRPYQVLCVAKAAKKNHGLFVAPCGSGKTNMALMLIAQKACRTLILVHTRELMRQWCERIEACTDVQAVTFGGGSKSHIFGHEPIIVATVQSLRKSASMMALMAETRDLVFTDECHHAPAATFTEMLAVLPARYRYGATATPTRADGLGVLMTWWIGPVLATIERAQLEEDGHVLRPELNVYETTFTATYDPEEPGDYGRLIAKMVDDQARFELVTGKIGGAFLRDPERIHLVLSGSVAYGERIAAEIAAGGIKTVLLHGQLGKKDREAEMEIAKASGARVIVATTLADEGLDLPALTDVWLVTPSRSATKTEQRVGRVCRPMPGKPTPRIHDFVDSAVARDVWHEGTQRLTKSRVFVNQFKERFLRVYKHIATYDEGAVGAIFKGGSR